MKLCLYLLNKSDIHIFDFIQIISIIRKTHLSDTSCGHPQVNMYNVAAAK